MTTRSNYTKRSQYITTGKRSTSRHLSSKRVLDLKALNMVVPDEVMEDGESPTLKNARYYAESDEGKRVAISTRRGPGFYTAPIGETENDTETSVTGAADQQLSTTRWLAQKFTPSATGRLTKLELNLKDDDGTGPILVKVYSDNSGEPGTLLGTTSILASELGTSYAYESARLVNAPQVTSGTDYWLVGHIQDDGTENYLWSSTTNSTDAAVSTDSGGTWSAQSFSLNFKVSISDDSSPVGYYREKRASGTTRTFKVVDTTLYEVDDTAGTSSSLETGLDSQATYYDWARLLDKTYFVNGYDETKVIDGSTVSEATNAPRGRLIIEHKNRLFIVRDSDPTRVEFSDLTDPETWKSTSFFHVPSPSTGDPITGWVVFQDNLVIFTRQSKYILYGTDPATFSLKQAVGKKGAVNQQVIATDEQYVYFLSDDGVYRFNGSTDERISDKIQPIITGIAGKNQAGAVYHDRKYRLYYRSPGQGFHNNMILWDTVYEGWFQDTGVYAKDAFVFEQESSQQLVEVSSVSGSLNFGENKFSDLGAPIAFEYRTKYFNFGDSIDEKLPRRFYPIVRAQDEPYNLVVGLDKDFANNPTNTNVAVQASGDEWGGGDLWGSTFAYGKNPFLKKRVAGNGECTYIQARFSRTGVENPVEIIGYEWFYKRKNRPR